MAKYRVSWTEEIWLRTIIEADSEEQASEIFWADMPDGETYGGEVQDGVDIEEWEND
jgi:hypothetical protein